MSSDQAMRPQRLSLIIVLAGLLAGWAGTGAQAADHFVSPSTENVDCTSFSGGVRPGDTVILGGTSRGPITFKNCVGTASSPITIRNDTSESGPLVVKQSGSGFKSRCDDCNHVVIDGTGKWAGAPAGACGVNVTNGRRTLGTRQCGIVFRCESGDPQSSLRFGRSSRNITVKGVEIDGNFPACSWGIGISVNDHKYLLADHPGEWREGYLLRNIYIHDTGRSGIYFGPNQNDRSVNDLQVRNNEIAYIYVNNTGCGGIKYKSSIEGSSSIHHNYVSNTGRSTGGSNSGCTSNGIVLYDGGYTDVHSNYVESPSQNSTGLGNCISHVSHSLSKSKVGTVPANIYNNTVHNCKGNGIAVFRSGSSVSAPVPTIFNNTIVAPIGGTGISVSSSIGSCIVRDNLVAGDSISAGQCSATNNRVGTVDSQNFRDSSRKNFQLTASSPALDSGSTNCPPLDQLRKSRPQGARCDQGALEGVGQNSTKQPNAPTPIAEN